MQVLIFNDFGLTMPIRAPEMEVLEGDYTPQMRITVIVNHKGHFLA